MTDLWDTRLQLHWAAQPAAGVGRTLAPPQPDFSHESFTWSEEHRALLGHRCGIRLPDMTLISLDDGDELPMNGRTLADGFEFFERRFGVPLKRPPEGMPDHPVTHGATFHAIPKHLSQLARCYADAAAALDEVRRNETGAGPLRCWPHHFDIATLMTISGSGEDARTIGAGMAPGDETYRQPYYYVTPWPYPKIESLPPLRHGAWHTKGWVGAVLPVNERSPREFFRQAIQHCRSSV